MFSDTELNSQQISNNIYSMLFSHADDVSGILIEKKIFLSLVSYAKDYLYAPLTASKKRYMDSIRQNTRSNSFRKCWTSFKWPNRANSPTSCRIPTRRERGNNINFNYVCILHYVNLRLPNSQQYPSQLHPITITNRVAIIHWIRLIYQVVQILPFNYDLQILPIVALALPPLPRTEYLYVYTYTAISVKYRSAPRMINIYQWI